MDTDVIFKTIIEGMNEAVYVRDMDMNIVYINPAGERLIGWSIDEAVGKKCFVVFGIDNSMCGGDCPVHKVITSNLPISGIESRLTSRHGAIIDVRVLISPYSSNGNQTGAIIVLEDITKEKKAEKILHDSEERFRGAFEYACVGMAVIGVSGEFMEVNSFLCEMLGYTSEELLTKGLSDVTHPDDCSCDRGWNEKILSGEARYFRKENRYIKKSGEIIWGLLNASVARAGEDNRPYIIIQIVDVTSLHKANEALEMSERKFRHIYEYSPIMMHSIDENGNICDVNRKWLEETGYAREEVIGKQADFLMVKESPKGAAPGVISRFWQNGVARDIPFEYVTKSGKTIDVLLNCDAAVEPSGKKVSLSVVRNVTERKKLWEHREMLAKAVENSTESIIITGADGRIQYVNPAFERITGYPRNEAEGRTLDFLKSDARAFSYYEQMWKTIRGGSIWESRIVSRKKDGALFEEDVTILPIFDTEGKIINYVSVRRDITHQAMLEKAKNYFTSVTSHELRTPLTKLNAVRMIMRRTGESHLDERTQEILRETLEASYNEFERIVSMTNLLTDLSRMDPNRKLPILNVSDIIRSHSQKLPHTLLDARRKLDTRFVIADDGRAIFIRGDMSLLDFALGELISNAVKYTDDGGEIIIAAREENGYAIIEVVDNGVGLPEGPSAEMIFEPYFSFENPLYHSSGQYKYQGGGMGLGLTIARMVAEYHSGAIEISGNGPGLGTTARIKIPLAEAPFTLK